MTILRRTIGGGCLAIAAFAGGSFCERRRIVSRLKERLNSDEAALEAFLDIDLFNPQSWNFGKVFAASLVKDGASRVSQIMKHGFPGLDNVRSFDDYVLSYDRRNRVPHWVFEHMNKATIQKNDAIDRSKCDFVPDESVHHYFRSENSDYKGSGFDRGHMAAAGNHRLAQRHVEQTFFLSNMAPQVGKGFNRDSWNRLEKHVRKLTNTYSDVYCCTGPLYLPKTEGDGKVYVRYQVIGGNFVAVPTHFFKVVVAETADGRYDMECYVMPNQVIADEIPISSFMVKPEMIERASGHLFFDKIPKTLFNTINGKPQTGLTSMIKRKRSPPPSPIS